MATRRARAAAGIAPEDRCNERFDNRTYRTPDGLEYGKACPERSTTRFQYAGALAAFNKPEGPFLRLCERHAAIYRAEHTDNYQEVV